MSEETPFPTEEALAEAWRMVHNRLSYEEGLGTLRTALATYQQAAALYEAQAVQQATLATQVADLECQCHAVQQDLDGLTALYTARLDEAEAAHQASMADLEAREAAALADAETAEEALATLHAQIATAQETAQVRIRETTAQAEQVAQATLAALEAKRDALQRDIAALDQDREVLGEALVSAARRALPGRV